MAKVVISSLFWPGIKLILAAPGGRAGGNRPASYRNAALVEWNEFR
jgi:hypothetical protein